MKKLILISLFSGILFARFSAIPTKECEAYNNMKHTKNSAHIILKKKQNYTVLKKYKGQYLLLIKGVTPAQRWVDNSCFSDKEKDHQRSEKPKHTKKYKKKIFTNRKRAKQTILVLSWHNAFCETHHNKQECRRDMTDEKGQLVLHGLWPQPRNNVYCGVPKKIVSKDKFKQWKALPNIDIEPQTLELMDIYMPGYISRLHKHEWIKHGTCYGTDADTYYRNALTMAKVIDDSKVGALLRRNVGKSITIGKVREAFDKSFGAGAGKKVEMKCKDRLLTELWINMGGAGMDVSGLIKQGKERRSGCRKALVDAK